MQLFQKNCNKRNVIGEMAAFMVFMLITATILFHGKYSCSPDLGKICNISPGNGGDCKHHGRTFALLNLPTGSHPQIGIMEVPPFF